MIKNLPQSLVESANEKLMQHLYESLLLEDRIQFLKDKHPVIDTSHDTFAQHKDASDIIDHLSSADPSKNKQYSQWILNQYKKKNIRQEDTGRISNALSNFDRYKAKLDKKDVNGYKTLGELETAVSPHVGKPSTAREYKEEAIVAGRTLVHDDGNGLKVYRLENTPEGKKASQEIYGGGHELGGTHTSWCTAARSKDCMFDHYSEDGHLYTIHTPTGNVYQAHAESEQLMDATDSPVVVDHHDAVHIGKALDHVPDGWRMALKHGFPVAKDHLDKAINDKDWYVREAAARNLNATKEHLDKAINDKDEYVRREAARNLNATKEHLDKAINDKDYSVRREAARNLNATKEHLDKAINDEDWNVRYAAAGNVNAAKEHLDKALNDKDEYVRSAAARNLSAAKEHLDKALNDEDAGVRSAAAKNHSAAKEHLDKALNDEDYSVRAAAAGNHSATKEHLDKALNDEDSDVRHAAKQNPNYKKYFG